MRMRNGQYRFMTSKRDVTHHNVRYFKVSRNGGKVTKRQGVDRLTPDIS